MKKIRKVKNLKYILAIASIFILVHIMELAFFPKDYIQEIKTIRADIAYLEKVAYLTDF